MAKKNATKKGGVAKMSQFKAEEVPVYLETLQQQRDALTGDKNEEVATDGNLEGFDTPISSTEDTSVLIRMAGSIVDRERIFNEGISALELDAKKHKFKIGKWSSDTWLKDIQRQIRAVTYKDEVAKIDRAIAIVERYQTEDQKMNQDMQELAHLLKK